MGRVGEADFEGKELARICIAASLSEAREIEDTLTKAGIQYLVVVEPFLRGTALFGFFTVPTQGAAFYVLSGQAEFCKNLLVEAGVGQAIVDD